MHEYLMHLWSAYESQPQRKLSAIEHQTRWCARNMQISISIWVCHISCFTVCPQEPIQWKALKCQTLGAAVHVIVLVFWLQTEHCLVTLSCLPCALFRSCPCKVCSRVSDALSQALCNLSLPFLANFMLSDSTAPIRFVVRLLSRANYTLLDRKTRLQRSHVFRLTGTEALHCRHTFVGGILPMAI